jgi:hypothetical protein
VQTPTGVYRDRMVELLKSGEATIAQYKAFADCVLVAAEYGHRDYRKCWKQIEDVIGLTAEQAEADREERKRERELARARRKAA